jgi:hypothetical protein
MLSSQPLKPRKRVSKPGSFLEICLAPGYYTYARKTPLKTRYTFYNILTTSSQREINALAQLPELLTVSLLGTPQWPVVGIIPLAEDPSTVYRSWHAKPLLPSEEQMTLGIRLPETEYFLIEESRDPITGFWDTTETPAKPDELHGLTRHASYVIDYVEDKLRLHYGLSASGERCLPVPLVQQELW